VSIGVKIWRERFFVQSAKVQLATCTLSRLATLAVLLLLAKDVDPNVVKQRLGYADVQTISKSGLLECVLADFRRSLVQSVYEQSIWL
jgi:hypothetical protein